MRGLLIVFFTLVFNSAIFAAAGFFESFAYMSINGGSNSFYDLGATTGNPDFHTANLGIFYQGQTIKLGGQIKTWKNSGSDVTGVSLYFRYYPIGMPSGSFTQLNYPFQNNLSNPGDQQWGTDINGINLSEQSIIILPANPSVGIYTLEIYVQVNTNGVDAAPQIYDSNGGQNYIATFTVQAPLSLSFLEFEAKAKSGLVELSTLLDYESTPISATFQRMSADHPKSTWSSVKIFTSSEIKESLELTDFDVDKGSYLYRLVILDADGITYHSPIRKVSLDQLNDISFYPNPVGNRLFVADLNPTEEFEIVLKDLWGREIKRSDITESDFSLDFIDISAGLYTVQVISEEGMVICNQLIIKE